MINGNMSQLNSLTGHLKGLQQGLQSRSYVASVLDYSHALLAEDLDRFVDIVAASDPSHYHHVYEWPTTFQQWNETVGVKRFRLWRHTITGPPANKVASFRFIASKRTVPVDPRLKAVGVVDKVHIFYLKASVFELGLPVTIRPSLQRKNGEKVGLSFIGTYGKNRGKPIFIPGQNATLRPPIPSGDKNLQGEFTAAYKTYWETGADEYFNTKILPKITKDLPLKNLIKKNAGSAVGLRVQDDNASYNNVLTQLNKNQKSYSAGAQARRDLILGG